MRSHPIRTFDLLVGLVAVLGMTSVATSESATDQQIGHHIERAQGAITGRIDDATGIGLPGVIVDAISVSPFDDGAVTQLAATADEQGRYQLDLPPGTYLVRFSLPGFQTIIRESIGVADGDRVQIDTRLRRTEMRLGVTVSGVHPYAARSSAFDRRPPVASDTKSHRCHTPDATPLVEIAPRSDRRTPGESACRGGLCACGTKESRP